MSFAKPIAVAIKVALSCSRVGVVVAGYEVPHAHVHLVPIQAIGDLNFAHAKPANMDDLKGLADKIVSVLE